MVRKKKLLIWCKGRKFRRGEESRSGEESIKRTVSVIKEEIKSKWRSKRS